MSRIESVAGALIAARRERRRLDTAALDAAPHTREDCYAVQQTVADAIAPAAAFKTARKGPGDVPIMAPILSGTVRDSGSTFSRDELSVIGVELEIGFRIDRPLPDPTGADFALRARECISLVPAIEVVDTRLADPESAGPMWRLADNQNNGGLVCGTPVADWQHLDLDAAGIDLTIGGVREYSGAHPSPGGNAFDVFCAFAAIVGSHCGGLQPGQTVITGSLMGCHYIEPGRNVRGVIDGLGVVEVGFP